MQRRIVFIVAALVLVLPVVALAAGLVPCTGADVSGKTTIGTCQTCDLVKLMQEVSAWLVGILTIVMAIIVAVAGYRLVISGGNPAEKAAAKSMMTNAVIGFVIVLSAWLLIDYGMKILLGGNTPVGPWNSIECTPQPSYTLREAGREELQYVSDPGGYIQSAQCGIGPSGNRTQCASARAGCVSGSGIAIIDDSQPNYEVRCVQGGSPELDCQRVSATSFDCTARERECLASNGSPNRDVSNPDQHRIICRLPTVGGGSDGGGGSNGSGGGSCAVITDSSNACHPSKMNCFGNREAASRVCNLESSGGNVRARSGSDLCRDGRSFSGGLWQINILANHHLVPGCSGNFFTKSGSSAQGSCARERTNSAGVTYCAVRNCTITDVGMYNRCMSQVLNPAVNIQVACRLYSQAGGWRPWITSAKKCRVY